MPMSNQLKMAKIDAIISLYQRNWSIRRIAKELGIHRDTVARQIQLWEQNSKPARAPLGSAEELAVCPESKPATSGEGAQAPKQATQEEGAHDSKQATFEGAPIGSVLTQADSKREPSLCAPWRQVILDKLAAGLTAQRIPHDLRSGQRITGTY